jgi:hypothetical protein
MEPIAASTAHAATARNPGCPTPSAARARVAPAATATRVASTPAPVSHSPAVAAPAGIANPAIPAAATPVAPSVIAPPRSSSSRARTVPPPMSMTATAQALMAVVVPSAANAVTTIASRPHRAASPRHTRRVMAGRQLSVRADSPVWIPSTRSSKSASGSWSSRGRRCRTSPSYSPAAAVPWSSSSGASPRRCSTQPPWPSPAVAREGSRCPSTVGIRSAIGTCAGTASSTLEVGPQIVSLHISPEPPVDGVAWAVTGAFEFIAAIPPTRHPFRQRFSPPDAARSQFPVRCERSGPLSHESTRVARELPRQHRPRAE